MKINSLKKYISANILSLYGYFILYISHGYTDTLAIFILFIAFGIFLILILFLLLVEFLIRKKFKYDVIKFSENKIYSVIFWIGIISSLILLIKILFYCFSLLALFSVYSFFNHLK